jgi:hypothetical protein
MLSELHSLNSKLCGKQYNKIVQLSNGLQLLNLNKADKLGQSNEQYVLSYVYGYGLDDYVLVFHWWCFKTCVFYMLSWWVAITGGPFVVKKTSCMFACKGEVYSQCSVIFLSMAAVFPCHGETRKLHR